MAHVRSGRRSRSGSRKRKSLRPNGTYHFTADVITDDNNFFRLWVGGGEGEPELLEAGNPKFPSAIKKKRGASPPSFFHYYYFFLLCPKLLPRSELRQSCRGKKAFPGLHWPKGWLTAQLEELGGGSVCTNLSLFLFLLFVLFLPQTTSTWWPWSSF